MTKKITALEVVRHGVLRLTFGAREVLDVDLSAAFADQGPMGRLREPRHFSKAAIGDDGTSVDWPGDIGIGADTLYCDAKTQAGEAWSPGEFNAWMERNGLTFDGAAAALGMSRRMVAYYNIGAKPVPIMVKLACRGWEVDNGPAAKKRRKRAA